MSGVSNSYLKYSKNSGSICTWIAVATLSLLYLLFIFSGNQHETFFLPHRSDFIEYWSAFQLWIKQLNPYLGSNMLSIQRDTVGSEIPLMMWNPPWILILLSPILALPYNSALIIWNLLNLLFVWASVELLAKVFSLNNLKIVSLVLILLLLPTRSSLNLGQLGTLLLFGSSLFLWGKTTQRNLVAGIGIAICSVKPHLFALPLIILVWELVSGRQYNKLCPTFAPLTLLIGSVLILDHQIVLNWIGSLSCHNCAAPAPALLDWISPNLPYLVRVGLQPLLSGTALAHPALLIMIFPFALITLSVILLIRIRPKLNWKLIFGPLLAIATYAAPFGWVFDQTVLGLLICQIVAETRQSPKIFYIALGMIIFWEASLIGWELTATQLHEFPPSGPALLAIWFVTRQLMSAPRTLSTA